MSKLYFFYGAMNSSKSAQLIMKVHSWKQQGKKVLVFKSSVDTRDEGIIKSRALETTLKADVVTPKDSGVMFKKVEKEKPSFVFVDEVNFLTSDQVEELADIVDYLDVPVFSYGLFNTFKSELFEGSKRMVELADSLREIVSQCYYCHRKANQNLRLIDTVPTFDGEDIKVGGNESYRQLCRRCFIKRKRKNKE